VTMRPNYTAWHTTVCVEYMHSTHLLVVTDMLARGPAAKDYASSDAVESEYFYSLLKAKVP